MDAPWKKAVSRLNSDALVTQLPSNSLLLFRAIQLLLLFPVSSVRLRTVLFLLRIRSDIFSGYYMRLRHLRYRFCFHLCTTLSLSVWTALHIFSPLSVTADCTGWYNFLPTTIYLWLISLTSSKELSILLLKLLECKSNRYSGFLLGLCARK